MENIKQRNELPPSVRVDEIRQEESLLIRALSNHEYYLSHAMRTTAGQTVPVGRGYLAKVLRTIVKVGHALEAAAIERKALHAAQSYDYVRAESALAHVQEQQRSRAGVRWAQFVYLGGGEPKGHDDQLRLQVCAAHDRDTNELKARVQEQQQEIARRESQLTVLQSSLKELIGKWETRPTTFESSEARQAREECAAQLATLIDQTE